MAPDCVGDGSDTPSLKDAFERNLGQRGRSAAQVTAIARANRSIGSTFVRDRGLSRQMPGVKLFNAPGILHPADNRLAPAVGSSAASGWVSVQVSRRRGPSA